MDDEYTTSLALSAAAFHLQLGTLSVLIVNHVIKLTDAVDAIESAQSLLKKAPGLPDEVKKRGVVELENALTSYRKLN
jgi:hypothetical protein